MQTELKHYPAIENVFDSGGLAAFLDRCGETCRQLDAIAHGPDSRLAERAKSAMTAYGHALSLLDRLAEEAATGHEETR